MEKNIFALKGEADAFLAKAEAASTLDEIEGAAAGLALMGNTASQFVSSRLKNSASPKAVRNLACLIELLNDYSYTELLKEMLLSHEGKRLPEEAKLEILSVLKSYEPSALNGSLAAIFPDPGEAYLKWASGVLRDFDAKEYRAISLLEEFLTGCPKNLPLLNSLSMLCGDNAVPLLDLLAQSDEQEISRCAMECLARIGSRRALEALKEVQVNAWRKESADAAGRLLRKLRFSGHPVEVAEKKEGLAAAPDLVYCSPVDGMGNLSICLASNRGRNRYDACFIVINDEVGIVDVCGANGITRTELSDMIAEAGEEAILQKTEAEFAFSLVQHALSLNEREKMPVPPEFFYRKGSLGIPAAPRVFTPRFGLSLLRRAHGDEALLQGSAGLFRDDAFRGWIISIPYVFDCAERFGTLIDKGGVLAKAGEEKLIKDFCRHVVLPFKDRIRQRLFIVAAFLERTKGRDEIFLATLSVALMLGRKTRRPLDEIPFFADLARNSMQHCLSALQNGFDMRRFDDEIDEMDE